MPIAGFFPGNHPVWFHSGVYLMSARRKLSVIALEDRTVPSGTYSIDGSNNNPQHPTWGSTGVDLLRTAPAAYGNGISTPAGANRQSARAISNIVADQGNQDIVNNRLMSAMVYAWGQFIDHDLDLTPTGGTEEFDIPVPTGDPYFDPNSTGTQVIPTTRSVFDPNTGTTTPRQQVNTITAWLDGSMIYGSNAYTAGALRTHTGGKMKTSAGADGIVGTADDLLPFNNLATLPGGILPMANDAMLVPEDQLFAAGDVRANENIELTSLQTLFVREHNYWATKIAAANPHWTDEQIYQAARSRVIAEIQSITYNQWLPTLLGSAGMPAYHGYQANVNPGIANEFSTAAFRFGHSLLGDDVEFLNNQGLPTADAVSLAQAFFNPPLVSQNGIDPILKYLSSDPSSELDTEVVGSVRNFLFGPPGSGGLDLASLNIQRGRDNGLADYNTIRQSYGLPRVTSFAQINSDPAVQAKLREAYGTTNGHDNVNNIDAWVGLLAEQHLKGSSVGVTMRAVLVNQFSRIRDGDPLYFERSMSGGSLRDVENTTLADIIARNTTTTNLQNDVFFFRAGVGGLVFGDANGNGRLDRGERGLVNQTVELVNVSDNNAVVATSHTNGLGLFQFGVLDGLGTGRYQIWVVDSSGTTIASSQTISITRGDQFPLVNIPISAGSGGRSASQQSGPSTSDQNFDLGSFDWFSDSGTDLTPGHGHRG
jgi:peroxidase